MKFNTFIPCEQLKPYVASLAIQEADDEQVFKVLPDTAIVIGFQFRGKLSYLQNEKELPLSSSGVTGLSDNYRLFRYSKNIGSVLVFFREAGAAHFFRQPLHELFRESVSLESFMLRSELLLLEEQLCAALTDTARVDVVERFLISRINFVQPDQLVLAALSLIHKSGGSIRIKELAGQLHTSQSPLEKRFRQAVGTSPKKFASIVRLKNAIKLYKHQDSFTGLAYEAGFYDQAHFIKEFKTFTGLSPETFFAGQP